MKTRKKDKYPVHWIRLAANQIYGSDVAYSTWRKWLRLFNVRPWVRDLTTEETVLILTYAHIRKFSPNKSVGVIDVKKHLKQQPYPVEKLKEQIEEALFIKATGRDLPILIRQYTGKNVTLRTLYRWAKKHQLDFGLNTPVCKLDLKKWLDIAS